MPTVSVAIPVLNGGASFREVLAAVARQRLDAEVELVVADSGSTDGTREFAVEQGARVVDIAPGTFTHSHARNVLMEHSAGDHVAFLTDDSVPASETWLAKLVDAFAIDDDIALAYGPYVPRADASPMVARELTEFFGSLSPDGRIRVDRGLREEDRRPGPVAFFTSANGCVARWAWERVPYRDVSYAEDRLLGAEMMEAGYAKAFHPGAGVVHSHSYGPVSQFHRCFDEWRGLREVLGLVESANPRHVGGRLRNEVKADRAFMRRCGMTRTEIARATPGCVRYHGVRLTASVVGSRADRLPPRLRRALSLERREGFEPAEGVGSQAVERSGALS
jgi:glycosyltransferase involved in cell wall biosynthesis